MGVGVSLTAYGACMVWQYEILRQKAYSMSKQFTNVHSGIRGQIHSIWKRMKLTEKVAVSIIAINTGVFLAWKVPALSRYMLKYFSSSPYSKAASSSMFFSFWSHYNTFHLLANMYVFWSFSYAAGALLGAPEMVAFFVTSGLLSNYGSYIFKALTHSRVPSLGASGAIMAILGLTCARFPEARLSIAFVDQLIPHSFTADNAKNGLILIDVLGIIFRWRLFDHAAHLSGMLFGLFYAHYGHKMVRAGAKPIMSKWHDLRRSSDK
ncbi:DgyrCDS7377 [Dimorphilus gyrociliatus]|uniref:rhomboid protease n=1 Tax=Dimorphilus gyrociliatus TaxID=2664684 RepID=A0A7I8VSL5_9ANNE|nr:DgyrCDS7377 [Dimorphilus gyrociliatus]